MIYILPRITNILPQFPYLNDISFNEVLVLKYGSIRDIDIYVSKTNHKKAILTTNSIYGNPYGPTLDDYVLLDALTIDNDEKEMLRNKIQTVFKFKVVIKVNEEHMRNIHHHGDFYRQWPLHFATVTQ